MTMRSLHILFGAFLASALLFACSKDEPAKTRPKLTINWFQWPPANGLQELANEYSAKHGVDVHVEQIPISSWQDKVFLEFGNTTTQFDIVVGDSQWIGRGATKGLYLELTDWLPTVTDMSKIHPRAASYLCTYPEGSNRWYAAPCETDAVGLAYRKDWFEDPKEREAFKAKYNRELGVPQTWEEFEQVAQFFQRPAEKRYGCVFTSNRAYDALVMGLQNLLWSFGGMWHEPGSNRVVGFLDTPGTAAAVDFFGKLIKLGPKGSENLDYGDTLENFSNGSTAMIVNYFAFFPGIYATFQDKVGFAVVPSKDGKRVASLGGQGMSISTKISKEQQALAKDFIAWFETREVQEQWVKKPAGFTANTEILASAAFRAQTPYNAPFADSIDSMQDFWNVPVYNELLSATQRFIGLALDGQMPTTQALKELAVEKERILRGAGLLK